ncbi:bifunctional diaminohydroxyphosphoribosylaminopyrimidine deaminase/5-amino-6-(5-phosphoribosylamino)uracil reductase RibD [Cohnella thailandensis]|uniref:Riboflavin biosynthesis protein RibD n=1 Tax=Cohnella thailandensis TaxID=557557 RepID=A0A841SU49_9BACL|nr:bifunctional diaminohydroxyphosphoribosylaminopyrimidine deaminase/5-amino-6-(5-phosphoribosylamino)uracil reductase RibD [Cohnella thailandensis]MBB6635454.1 bifunctional diaminohydroxyphosphoribosylaminopyrimidine deaminase/5-amino-6-(5-phosphoribosylamino)uracil reductase RibD [Cohnella thailandensis]MBP1974834.1 diaminohydroxyphosphoribosylaminopyrimidine deaminase/5-amino-6-(5-phosphoribosylamino)uracil reductase [Cohnella thailandensis]
MEVINDEFYMRLALQAASSAAGQTSINPVVGCVVVNEGRVVGIGAHLKRGEGHAEVHALNMAGDYAKGATAYVTLEPCSHHGRTPPCCERLIQEGVKRVVVAATDPNPLVAGRGIKRLREAGVDVTVGLLEEESRKLNEAFNKYIMTKLPFVTIKTAATLDGRVATRTGHSRWITGPEAREAVHTLRHRNAAILVGVSTILADDSELTTRLSVPGLHPIRIVVDSKLRTPVSARVLNGEAPTILLTTESAPAERARELEAQGAEVIACGPGPRVDLALALKKLGEKEIGSILVEGGGTINGSLLEAGLVDKIMLFYAPKLVGSEAPSAFAFQGPDRMGDALELENVSVEHFGRDWCVTGYPSNRAKPE